MYRHPYTVSNSVREINMYITAMHRSMKDVALAETNAEIDSAVTVVYIYSRKVSETFGIVFERFLGDPAVVDQAYKKFLAWEEIRKEVIQLKRQGEDEKAAKITKGKGAVYVNELMQQTKEMTDFAQSMANKFYKNAHKSERNISLILSLTIFFLFALSLFITYVIGESITRPIQKFVAEIKELFSKHNKPSIEFRHISEKELFETTIHELKEAYSEIEESNKKLKKFNQELESKIKERTKELEKKNKDYVSLNNLYLSQNEALENSLAKLTSINQELISAKEKAEENDRLKTAFLANMSHEIRSPMNGIVGFANLLNQTELSGEKQGKYLRIIEQSGERMLKLIDDLINISKIEANQMELVNIEVDVNEVLESLDTFFKHEIGEKNIYLILDGLLPFGGSKVLLDETKLQQILTNLLKNAQKFTESGYIKFGCHLEGDKIEFYVQDTGIGISENDQITIFERFNRGGIDIIKTYEGVGLGLSISKAFVELMGGKMKLESEKGKGSRFLFTLPYVPVS